MDKDAVSGLAVNELAGFPLDDFFDHYERGLRKVRIANIFRFVTLLLLKFSRRIFAVVRYY